MSDEIEGQLARIASVMNSLRATTEAHVSYDAASDALVWSDELPQPGQFRVRELWCLRPVLRYRSSVILGNPENQFRAAWEAAQRLFPDWAGFEATRSAQGLAETLTQLSQSTREDIGKLFD